MEFKTPIQIFLKIITNSSPSPIFSQRIAFKEDFELCSEVGKMCHFFELEKVFLPELSFECDSDFQIGQLAKSLTAVDKFWSSSCFC